MEAQKRMAVEKKSGQGEPNTFKSMVVLKELFELLEDYGPVWYTEEMHERARAALTQCLCCAEAMSVSIALSSLHNPH